MCFFGIGLFVFLGLGLFSRGGVCGCVSHVDSFVNVVRMLVLWVMLMVVVVVSLVLRVCVCWVR